MTLGSKIAWDDTVLPFQLDRADIRGRLVRLDGVLEQLLSQHRYPAPVAGLVAEAALLTALIGQTIKLRWRLSLQIRGTGPVRMVATDYYAPTQDGRPARMRAYANFEPGTLPDVAKPVDLLGEGYFVIVLDQGSGMVPYQGITPLSGASLAACAESYFAQSEQLPTRFELSFGQARVPGDAQRWRGGGVMLQHMPKSARHVGDAGGSGDGGLMAAADLVSGEDEENWTRANLMLDTAEAMELIGPTVQPTDLLVRLFHQEGPRVFDAQPITFGCSCSAQKVRDSLSIYPADEIAQMTTDDGIVTADCQFCGAHYEFDPATLGREARENGADRD